MKKPSERIDELVRAMKIMDKKDPDIKNEDYEEAATKKYLDEVLPVIFAKLDLNL